MQKSKSYVLISLLLVASMLMSAMAPVFQESPSYSETEAAVLTEAAIEEQNSNEDAIETDTQMSQQDLLTESDDKAVNSTDESAGENSVATDSEEMNVEDPENTADEFDEITDDNGDAEIQNDVIPEDTEVPEDDDNSKEEDLLEEALDSGDEQINSVGPEVVINVASTEGKPEFTITIANQSDVQLIDIVVDSSVSVAYNSTGTMKAYTGKFVSTAEGSIEESKSSYKFASLEPEQSVVLNFSIDLPGGFSVANVNSVFTVSASYLDGEETKTAAASNAASSIVNGSDLQFAQLIITLSDEKEGFYFPGEAILHQVVVSNEGEFDVSNVEINYNGLSAENYEDIPCVFTSVCENGSCATIPQDEQDSVYTVASISAGQFVSLYCENGVNNSYDENISYFGSVNVTAIANDKEDGTVPADYNVVSQSNNVNVEVVVPLAQSAVFSMVSTPLFAAAPTSYIFSVDCVHTTCFTPDEFGNIPMYVSFRNTSSDGSYCSVTMTSDSLPGKFTQYGRGTNGQALNSIILSDVSSPSGNYTFSNIAPGDIVVAVFEADPSQNNSFEFSKDYYFKFNASVNDCSSSEKVSAEASKSSCDPEPGFYAVTFAQCVQPSSTTAVHEITIVNNGDVDLCQLLGNTRADGTFAESGSKRLTYNEKIAKGSSKTFTFSQNIDPTSTGSIEFTFAGYGCEDTSVEVSSSVSSSFEYCETPEPGMEISVEPVPDCHEPESGDDDEFTVHVTNTGEKNLCKAVLVAEYEYNGSVIYTEEKSVPDALLIAGAEGDVIFTFNPDQYDIPEGATYTFHVELKAYDGENGTCRNEPDITAEDETDIEMCTVEKDPGMEISVEPVPDCHEPESGDDDEFTVHVTNTGEKDLCKAVLIAKYEYNGTVLYIEEKSIPADLLVAGEEGDVIFTFNPDQYDIPEGATYTFHVDLEAYNGENGTCNDAPDIMAEDQTDMEMCTVEKMPDMDLLVDSPDECHENGSGEEEFVITISNTGTKELCSATLEYNFEYNGTIVLATTTDLPQFFLEPGESAKTKALFDPDEYGIPAGATYTINVTLIAYDGENGNCDDVPVVEIEASADAVNCDETPKEPGMNLDIEENPECHPTGSGEEEFVVDIKNTGEADMCSAVVEVKYEYNGQTVFSESKEVHAELLVAGSEGSISFYFDPEDFGISEGESYTFYARLIAYGDEDGDGTCDDDPTVDTEKSADMSVCPREPHNITVYNLNNSCYDGDEVLSFKGIVDIPEDADIESIYVETNQVKFGSQKYDCVITQVMNVGDGDNDFVDLEESEQGTTYTFEGVVPGKGAAGFICQVKLDSNQVANGRKITFSATSLANYSNYEEEVESNEVVDTQNCVRVRHINLPNTGDDTNMPFLIGGFALLVILAGGSSIAIKKRKDNNSAE